MKNLILIVAAISSLLIISCKKSKPAEPSPSNEIQTRVSFFAKTYNSSWEFKQKFKFGYGKNINYYVNGKQIPLSSVVNEGDSVLQFWTYNIPYHPGDVLSVKFDTAIYSVPVMMNNFAEISLDTLNADGKSWDQKQQLAFLSLVKSAVGGPTDIKDKSTIYYMCFNKSLTCTVK